MGGAWCVDSLLDCRITGAELACRELEKPGPAFRINRCLSSISFSSSLSESLPDPNVSSSVRLMPAEPRKMCRRDAVEDARDRNDGGGEAGVWEGI